MNAATLASFMNRSIFEILSRGTNTMSPACNVKSFSRSLVRLMLFRLSSFTSAKSELIVRKTTTCDDFAGNDKIRTLKFLQHNGRDRVLQTRARLPQDRRARLLDRKASDL